MLPPIAPGSKKVLDKRRMAHKIAQASVQRIGRIKHIFAAASPCGSWTGEQWRSLSWELLHDGQTSLHQGHAGRARISAVAQSAPTPTHCRYTTAVGAAGQLWPMEHRTWSCVAKAERARLRWQGSQHAGWPRLSGRKTTARRAMAISSPATRKALRQQ